MKRKRILLVEDHVDILEMLSIVLSDKFDVSSCSSAADALTLLDKAKPDLLVLDVVMSPIGGLQCLEAIRARPGYHDIPAVALTALAYDTEKHEMLAAGFQSVVVKPLYDERELLDVIDSLLLPDLMADGTVWT